MLLRFLRVFALLVIVALLVIAAPPGLVVAQSGTSSPEADGSGEPNSAEPQAGDRSLTTRLSFYNNGDSGDGNPFLDESLTVVEPVFIFDHQVTDDFGYAVDIHYDYVSSASIDRLSNFPEQSGASADNYIGTTLSGRWNLSDGWKAGGSFSVSGEYDYKSIGFGGNISRPVAGQDATIGLSIHGYFDDLSIIRYNGEQDGNEARTSVSTTASWYQVLTPDLHGSFGVTATFQDGFLSTPYNAVVIEDPLAPPNPNLDNNALGFETAEVLPDARVRTAFFGRVRGFVSTGRAWELGGRIYSDDWGITSFSFEPRWYQTVIESKLDAMVRYRFYSQTAADDYGEHFFVPEQFMTQDSDLAELNSNTIGGRLIWHLDDGDHISLGLDHVLRSDGLDQILATCSWEHSF